MPSERPLPELKFAATPFNDVLDFLADASGCNFSIDWKALEAAHIEKDVPISLRMSSAVPLRKVLNLVFQQAAGAGGLTYSVSDGVIEITTQEASDKQLYSRTYPIQDLLFQAPDYTGAPNLSLQNATQGQSGGGGGGGGTSSSSIFSGDANSNSSADAANTSSARAQEIIKLITDTVKPELWQINGGTATISFFRGSLIVNAPQSIHQMLQNQ